MMFQTLRRMMGEGETLKIECETCRRAATWTRTEAFARLGPDATPSDIRRRLCCGGCTSFGAARIWI